MKGNHMTKKPTKKKKPPVMTTEEFKEWMQAMGFETYKQAATALDLSEKRIGQIVRGEASIDDIRTKYACEWLEHQNTGRPIDFDKGKIVITVPGKKSVKLDAGRAIISVE